MWQLCVFVFSLSLAASPAFSATVSYTYDVHHRLTHVAYDNGAAVQYSYDTTSNRLTKSSSKATSQAYEDAEDGNIAGWDIYDNDPTGATITNVFDADRASNVIEFIGSGTNNSYRLRNADGTDWNDAAFKVLEWSMKYSESFTVYIAVQTKDGFRYLYYTPVTSNSLGTGTYIHHGLGTNTPNANWHTFVRDLAYDLHEAQPNNELEAVLGFLIRGNGRVDDIKTRKDIPANQDSDGDGVTDTNEITIYGTHPYKADSDDDGVNDKEELTFWGVNWNADPDGDGIINILDNDSDNDGFSDGYEIGQGTNPADPASKPEDPVPVGVTLPGSLQAVLYLLLPSPKPTPIIGPEP
ncbi:MAG: thrombospondin type 3 repeat-containing protein [Proteobacteria bacterium]|nr:thrombospondin type 3 repeat-containing protein [Pseudomonadota bacterium]